MTVAASSPIDSSTPAHERYQHKPCLGSSHSWAEKQFEQIAKGTPVLDVGVGSGAMAIALRELGFTAVYGIEIDPAASANAAPYYDSIESSIEPFAGKNFGLILMLDVLEHMSDPETFLGKAAGLLSSGGTMLISLPNVAHWSVRLSLLLGLFEYTGRGILDRTHLQFFTRRRVKRFIANCPGLAIEELSCSIEPVEFILPQAIGSHSWFQALSKVRLGLARCLPGLLGYQHLVRVRKS